MRSEKNLKLLPLGEQNFRKIIEKDLLYVDKTEDIYNLLSTRGTYFFLSRPRRFGKSLLISTLEEIFLGNQELFKGLYIYDKIEWKKYPVIKIDFNHIDISSSEKLEEHLNKILNSIARENNISFIEGTDYKSKFEELIIGLSKINKVVILIDEYDKPIIDHLKESKEDLDISLRNREILKNFYNSIKANDKFIHFAFLTGVSKFSKTSIFSSLNNLTDLSMYDKYSNLVGITESELYIYFNDYIEKLAENNEISINKIKILLKEWYNGYSWNGKDFVYNPYSLLSVFDSNKIKNYWFKTGTPTFLIKLIREFNLNIAKLEKLILNEEDFETYDLDNMNIYALLFQTGYLTIKEIIKNGVEIEYVLSYPNKEVKDSMLDYLLDDYAYQQVSNDISINEMVRKLKSNDLEGLMNIFISIFGTIAVKMQPDKKVSLYERELYYHTIFYLIFTLIGSKIKAEFSTSKGFIDAVAETNTHVYIFEFKMNNPEIAINQIREKKYYESFLSSNKEIVLVGVSFDSENKNIKDWKVQLIMNDQ
ncbi:MAG: AAA family ATPase [Candidatus Sericytochromatia bacterium]